jgi:serine/threonine protein kinase
MNIRELNAGLEIYDNDRVYTLETKLGEGGQGVCYRANFHGDPKTLKLIQTTENLDERLRSRLLELNAALGTRYRVFKIDPITFGIVGDYYEGKNLKETIDVNDRVFTEEETKEFLLQMCRRWLGPLYSRRLIHHDIKPENIIVNDGIYSLIDFGGVRSLDSRSLSLGVDENVVKSFGYSKFWGERSLQDDLYSVAKVIGFMLTGKEPEVLLTTNEEFDKAVSSKFVDSLKVNDRLKNVLRRMLSVTNPYSTPEEIVMDLEERTRLAVPNTVQVVKKLEIEDLIEEFEKEYLNYGPEVKPLSGDFKERLESVLMRLGFVKDDWTIVGDQKSYFSILGEGFCRKLIDLRGYDKFFYLNKGNFYFGLVYMNSPDFVDISKYVPKRLESRRGYGFLDTFVLRYSPIRWDTSILKVILSLE